MHRRDFLQSLTERLAVMSLHGPLVGRRLAELTPRAAIDRRARVARHSPVVRSLDPLAPLSVGNGAFAFTADATGLQTFSDVYTQIPLATQAEWGWHTFPNPQGHRLEQALVSYDAHGRQVPYASAQNSDAGKWLRENPHRLSLARVGFALHRRDGDGARPADVQDMRQRLDLWSGTLDSRFTIDDRIVRVHTWSHPTRDAIAVRIESYDLDARWLAIDIAFPYGGALHTGSPSDWAHAERHQTSITRRDRTTADWQRTLDADSYRARAGWSRGGTLEQVSEHAYRLAPARGSARFDVVIEFSPTEQSSALPSVDDVIAASARHWEQFWTRGGVVDLSGSRDPRAKELERRIVLSEYLTAIQCAGSLPPQETGETFNSWFGKFHLEMHWWHAAHFALWNRTAMLEKSLPFYSRILPRARETARRQGYDGVRWPKMIGPDGRESPSGVGAFLIWQQPHPIYMAELVYRARPTRGVLDRYRVIVHESASFMASYPFWDDAGRRYVLGPPLIPAQESHPPAATFNPAFELSYWAFGLSTAQTWRERLGLAREPTWDRVIQRLSAMPMRDGLYVNAESAPDTFTNADQRRDHPTLLAAFGFIPSPRIDRDAMRRTLHRVMETWQWDDTWGWDYPMVAMTAARLGEPEIAIDALMMDMPKNRFLPNGHNYQRTGLSIYLPGNGALLSAIAMMAAGWDGAPTTHAPGFPARGWNVQWEKLRPMP